MGMTGPPSKRIKCGQELVDLINECYALTFVKSSKKEILTPEDAESLKQGIQKIRETIEKTTSSSEVSFGVTKPAAKINWGKCLGLLLEDGSNSFGAIKVLTERLSPGGGLL